MSEIIETYQQEQEQLGKTELPQMAFATVVSVNDDGLEMIFDGEEEASTKRFPCNTGVSFSAGQRVLMMKVNGSYIALCPVGLQGGGGGGGGVEVLMHRETVYAVGSDERQTLQVTITNSGKTPIGIVGMTNDSGLPIVMENFYLSQAIEGRGIITATYNNLSADTGRYVWFDFYVMWQ